MSVTSVTQVKAGAVRAYPLVFDEEVFARTQDERWLILQEDTHHAQRVSVRKSSIAARMLLLRRRNGHAGGNVWKINAKGLQFCRSTPTMHSGWVYANQVLAPCGPHVTQC